MYLTDCKYIAETSIYFENGIDRLNQNWLQFKLSSLKYYCKMIFSNRIDRNGGVGNGIVMIDLYSTYFI